MHLRPAKYFEPLVEVPDDVRSAIKGDIGLGSRLLMPVSIFDSNNNIHNHQFTVNSHGRTTKAQPNEINTKLSSSNNNNNRNQHDSSRYYFNYPDSNSYCFDGSKRFLTFEYSPDINYSNSNNNLTNYNSKVTNFTKLDKTKQMEQSIINLVELSTFAAEEGKFDIALDRAKEALKSFNSLNVFMMQQKSLTNNQTTNYRNNDKIQQTLMPMTTSVRLFEFAIMVNSNLACQLKNNGHFDDSLELYTQLCKLATGNSSISSTFNQTVQKSVLSQQQFDAKFLLHRFGINIGNVLYDMNEYQRSLKYYRLTLDRLSSSGQESLKVKLMNNISITILTMKTGKPDMDAITSLNLLLSDNLSSALQTPQQQQQADRDQHVDQQQQQPQQQQQQHQQQQQQLNANKIGLEVCNSNHHKFGLYLIVCHYLRDNLTSMMSALKGLVKVDICRHYKRVFELDDTMSMSMKNIKNDRQRQSKVSALSSSVVMSNEGRSSNSSSATSLSAVTDTGSSSHVTSTADLLQLQQQQQQIASHNRYPTSMVRTNRGNDNNRAETILLNQRRTANLTSKQRISEVGELLLDQESSDQPSGIDNVTVSIEANTTTSIGSGKFKTPTFVKPPSAVATALTKLSVFEKVEHVMSCIQQDRLEILIGEKHNQISSSLIMACNLLLEFDLVTNRTSRQQQQQKVRKSNVVVDAKKEEENTDTSVYEFCMKLLNSNETYKTLVCDLKINNISEMLNNKTYKLDEAIALLKDIQKDEQKNKINTLTGKCGRQKLMSNNNPLVALKNRTSSIKKNSDNTYNNVILKSSILATNSSLLKLLQNKPREALESAKLALKLDKSNFNAYINLANSYYYLNNLSVAESLYQQAGCLIENSSSWEATYNLALVGRKLGHEDSNELKAFTDLMLTHNKLGFNSLTSRTMTIPNIQMALIYQQTGDYFQAITILDDLIKNSRHSPEICLILSKLLEENDRNSITKTSAMSVLQQANRENPYHLPILERLIALNIKNFNYESAEELLKNCIRNRPHQVRWYQMLAECQRRATDYNKSIVTYKTAIDMFPRDISCLKALIKLTGELGLVEENKFYVARLQRTAYQGNSQDT